MQNNSENNSTAIQRFKNDDAIDLRELLMKYLRKWYWFVLALILAVFIATLFILSTVNKYEIKTTLLLRNDKSSGMAQMAMMDDLGFLGGVSSEVEDEIQVISSKKLINQTIDTLNLQTVYYKKDKLRFVDLYNETPLRLNVSKEFLDTLKRSLTFTVKETNGTFKLKATDGNIFKETYSLKNIGQAFDTPYGKLSFTANSLIKKNSQFKIIVYPLDNLINSYGNNIKVAAINKKSNAIQISMLHSHVQKAKDILNMLVYLYNQDAILDKNLIASNTANFIEDRLGLITRELFEIESDIENYKRGNKLTNLSSEASIYLQSAGEYEKRLTELETQMNMINYVENYIKDPKNQNNLIPTNIVTSDLTLARSIQEYNIAVLERMKLAQTANEKNPAVIMVDEQIKALKSNVLASVSSVKSGLQISRNDALKKENQFTSRIQQVPTQERQFLEIQRQQGIKQNLFLVLSQKREETALTLASTPPAARTIDRAFSSILPVEPKKMIIYLVALILGMLVPFLFIYIRDIINNKIEDSREFKRLIQAPYLGNISTSRESERVVVQEGKTTPIVEMFRQIRTNLQFLVGETKNPVILVTSSISGEGKSFTSINLAMSFALMKKKVVLVGLDTRNPMLSEYMHIPKNNGVTLYLSDRSYELNDIIVKSEFHKFLDVIPAGPIPPNPSELIMGPRLEELMASLKEMYDYIIVDTAPIGVVSDTYLLNRVADNSIYVARQDYTPRDATELINEIYQEKRLKGMGVVLNGTPASTGYGYSYGYGTKYKSSRAPKVSFGDKIFDYFEKIRSKK